ncbi:2Fe-2S iron-sulfur cluster-binding protein [Cupriavidus basilensis]
MPSGHKFEVATDETILGAALRHSIGLPYGCKNGACGSCKGRVLEEHDRPGRPRPGGTDRARKDRRPCAVLLRQRQLGHHHRMPRSPRRGRHPHQEGCRAASPRWNAWPTM